MKILFLDIETAPNLVWVWQLWQQNVAPTQVKIGTSILSWAAKWHKNNSIMYDSVHDSSLDKMLKGIHKLLDEADVVVHYYGSKFDIPMLNREFLRLGLRPPSTYKQVDLKKVIAEKFRFPSNKLEYVSKELKLGEKIKTDFDLWKDCMAGNQAAWDKMESYNKHDVRLLERAYDKVLPWIGNHPNHSVYADAPVCANCGKSDFKKNGFYYTGAKKYQRYECHDCGAPFRDSKAIKSKSQFRSLSA